MRILILTCLMMLMTACSTVGTILAASGKGLSEVKHSDTKQCEFSQVYGTNNYDGLCR